MNHWLLIRTKSQSLVYVFLVRQFTFKDCGIKKISGSKSGLRKHTKNSVSSIVQYIFVDFNENHIPQPIIFSASVPEVHLQLITNRVY